MAGTCLTGGGVWVWRDRRPAPREASGPDGLGAEEEDAEETKIRKGLPCLEAGPAGEPRGRACLPAIPGKGCRRAGQARRKDEDRGEPDTGRMKTEGNRKPNRELENI